MSKVIVTVGEDSWPFDAERCLNVELMAIERATGFNANEFENGVNRGSVIACTALVWILKRRHVDPATLFDDIVFEMGDFNLKAEDDAPLDSEAPPENVGSSEPTSPPESGSSSSTGSDPGSATGSSEPTT